MADKQVNVVTQKVPEKLLILRERGIGLITRIYNIKKIQADPTLKPEFMSEKHLETPIKLLEKKFPDCKDTKILTAIRPLKQEISKALSSYYSTLLDVMHFRQCVDMLLNSIDSCSIFFDITATFDLTRLYLDVVCIYIRLMILLSRIDDRKAVLGLFNAANYSVHGTSDSNFEELAKMIIQFDAPYKQLEKEFEPHRNALSKALLSLNAIYPRRNATADNWIKSDMLSMIAKSGELATPTSSDVMSCEFLSLITIEHWIVFGFMVSHSCLTNPTATKLWTMALQSGWVMTLFRDEVIYIHKEIQTFFGGIKGYGKRAKEVKELYEYAVQNSTRIHQARREYLRTSLGDMVLICTDEPGLIAPKMLLILMGLCFSKDEITWMIHHHENLPTKNVKQNTKLAEDLDERFLAEMLFYMEQMRRLIRKYDRVIKKYYVQFLSAHDVIDLKESIKDFGFLTEEDNMLLDYMVQTISDDLNVEQVDDPEHTFDFLGLRMDWARLQAYISSITDTRMAKWDEFKKSNAAEILNTIVFHSNLVDNMESLLADTSDMSLFYFYPTFFEKKFMNCLKLTDPFSKETRRNHDQMRYSIVFPLICTHFAQIINEEYCPEEAVQVRQKGLQLINLFLDEMSKDAKSAIAHLCNEQAQLAQKLLPTSVTQAYMERATKRRKEKMAAYPGIESYRISRTDITKMDDLCLALSELCVALNFTRTFSVWDYTFCPKDYLGKHLENKITSGVNAIVNHSPENPGSITKPSEMLTYMQSYLEVLQSLDNFMPMNVLEIFKKVLLAQTLPEDASGEMTVAAKYTNWYGEILFRLISQGEICFSPDLRAFVSLESNGKASFDAEEYTDPKEVRALIELLGPMGTRLLNEKLVFHIGEQVQELKKLVQVNKNTLVILKGSLDAPDEMKKLTSQLTDVQTLLQRVTIIGNYLSFRKLLFDAVNEKMEDRLPYIHSSVTSIHNFHDDFSMEDMQLVNEMSSAIGLHIVQEPLLTQHIKELPQTDVDDDYTVACLLMTFIAVAIPELAQSENSKFNVKIGGHNNNIHCIAPAVNQIFTVLFTLGGKDDIEERIREFFSIVSSSLLHLGETVEKRRRSKQKKELVNLESIYILLDIIVHESDFLTMDILERCFPYTLIRKSYYTVHKEQKTKEEKEKKEVNLQTKEE